MKLRPHHRIHIPNSLAVLAAVLLLASGVTGFEADHESWSSSQETAPVVETEEPENERVTDVSSSQPRSFNLGSLLFLVRR